MHATFPLSRRSFLRLGLGAGACACFFPARLLAAPPAPAASGPDETSAARALQAEFNGVSQGAEAWLAPRTGARQAAAIAEASRARFAALLPAIPDVGQHTPEGNRNLESLMQAVWLTAITQAMQAHRLPEKDAGRLFYDLCVEEMAQRPAAEMRAKGRAMFSEQGRAELVAWTKATQARRYPGDWVGGAVFGDGQDFDLGYDYSECGAVKFFQAQGVGAVAPYFCLNDFTLSKAQGTGLARVHTLAQGDRLCDFRYTLDRPVTQSWETETPRLEKQSA